MHNQATIDYDGVQITLKNTLRITVRYLAWKKAWIYSPDSIDLGWRSDFIWIVAHMVEIRGLDWKPPADTATSEEIEAAYQRYLDTGTQELLRDICGQAVTALHRPQADEVEKPDSTLTEDEKKTKTS
jgi:hypothetical protein